MIPIITNELFQTESASVDADIQKEYSRQREHLERSVASLRKKLSKDSEIHRADNVRIMQVQLTFIIYSYFVQNNSTCICFVSEINNKKCVKFLCLFI